MKGQNSGQLQTASCVYLVVGPRGSGKSNYAKRLLTRQSDLSFISRDEILVRRFGSADISPYTGGHWYAREVMHRLLRFTFGTCPNVKIILDCWTGTSEERASLLQTLREYGAKRVVALFFVTPRKVVEDWFWHKPGVAKLGDMKSHNENEKDTTYYDEDAPLRDYDIFHRLAQQIELDGFDEIIRVDPRKEPILLEGVK